MMETRSTQADRLLTVDDLADVLQVPPATLYQWSYRKVGPTPIKVGKHLRWRRAEVNRWLDQQTKSA